MKNSSYHILRVGVAITFLWMSILILKDTAAWEGFLLPWASNILFLGNATMAVFAVSGIIIGIMLLIDYYVWLASLLASLELILILAVSGINSITVRDIGLLAATLSLFTSFKKL